MAVRGWASLSHAYIGDLKNSTYMYMLLGSFVCDVFLCLCHLPYDVLGQVWYLIVWISDLCLRPYLSKRSVTVPICENILNLIFW